MALEGSLADFGLADILQLIYFQKKTGKLTLSGKRDKVRLLFSDGNVISAESRKRLDEERIGRILLKKGFVKEDELKACIEEQKTTGGKLGDILFKRKLVPKKDIEETLISQMTEAVVQLFSWKEGRYEFQSQTVGEVKDIAISLDTQHLLMEGLRIIDEWSLVEGKITLDTVFNRTGKGDAAISREEEEILRFVDGENDVSIIIDLSGASDFTVSRMLVSLMERGIIEPVEAAPVMEEAPVAAAVKTARPVIGFMIWLIFFAVLAVSFGVAALQLKGALIFQGSDSLNRIKAVKDIENMRFNVELYKYKHGSYPQSLRSLASANDPWGRSYLYKVETGGFLIVSTGRDGKSGTADDIY